MDDIREKNKVIRKINEILTNHRVKLIVLFLADVLAVILASFLGVFIRFDFSINNIPVEYIEKIILLFPANLVIIFTFYFIFRLYKSVWRYASAMELLRIIVAIFISTISQKIIIDIFRLDLPRSYSFLYGLSLLMLGIGIRFSYRAIRILNSRWNIKKSKKMKKKCMIIGAGSAGNMILKEIESSIYVDIEVCCVIDDQEGCHGKYLRGIPIIGGREKILEATEEYSIEEIIIAIPSASPSQLKPIINICKDTRCNLKITPGLYQLVNGEISISKLREVNIEDLLGRDPVKVNFGEISEYVKGKVVMVTGGGGSIGANYYAKLLKKSQKN